MDKDIIKSRLKQLDNILNNNNETKEYIKNIQELLKWDQITVKQANLFIECPVDKSHVILPSNLRKHVMKCHKEFINNLDLGNFSNESLLTTKPECFYSREERLAMYDNIVAQSSSNSFHVLHQFQSHNQSEHESKLPKSYLEELALMRDLKRRRSKYKVSTKSKSYTEVIREVIGNQMDLFESCIITKRHDLPNRGDDSRISGSRESGKIYKQYRDKHK